MASASADEERLGARAGLFDDTCLSGEIGNPTVPSDNSYTVVTIDSAPPIGATLDAVIDGFCIRDGYNEVGGPQAHGGGIRVGDPG